MTALLLLALTMPQDPPDQGMPDQGVPEQEVDPADRQQRIARRYGEFETVVRRMSDLIRTTDPERAALLRKVFRQSREGLVGDRLAELTDRLQSGEYGDAVKDQQQLAEDMTVLLELLLSEDRAKQLEEKRRRTEEYLQEIRELRSAQQALRAATERDRSAEGEGTLGQRQQDLEQQTRELADRVEREDAAAQGAARPAEGEPSQGQPSEGQPSQGQPSEGQPSEGEPSQGQPSEGQPSEGQPSQGQPSEGQPSQGQPSEGQPSQGKPSEGQPSPDQRSADPNDPQAPTPGRENVRKAAEDMRQAQDLLDELKREKASRKQDEAIGELDRAIAELEEILRQLREEERLQRLADMESRCRRMLEMQRIVLDSTVRLHETAGDAALSRIDEQKSVKLGEREDRIVAEAEQALLLLREDGTATAFPEVMVQVADDATLVAGQLGGAQIGPFTQQVEQDVIDALDQMVLALQQEMKEAREKKESQSQPAEAGDPALVNRLAELKMIRGLQQRVRQRTEQVQAAADGESAASVASLRRSLAERQDRIYRITRDIVLGVNQ